MKKLFILAIIAFTMCAQAQTMRVSLDTVSNNGAAKIFGCIPNYSSATLYKRSIDSWARWEITRVVWSDLAHTTVDTVITDIFYGDTVTLLPMHTGELWYFGSQALLGINYDFLLVDGPAWTAGNVTITPCGNMFCADINGLNSWRNVTYEWADGMHYNEQSWCANAPGTYGLYMYNGCGAPVQVTYTVLEDIFNALDLGPDQQITAGQTITLTPNNIGMDEYLWFKINDTVFANTPSFQVTQPGTYVCIVSDTNVAPPCGWIDTITITSVLTSMESPAATILNIYPNPTNDMLYIQGASEASEYKVFDVMGKLITSGKGKTIKMAEYKTGFYTVKIITERGICTSKVLKE